jgi:hypothetical protein
MILWQREPTLNEMLADPLIKLLMRADGVDAETLRPQLNAVARKLQGSKRDQADPERPSSLPRTMDLCCAA